MSADNNMATKRVEVSPKLAGEWLDKHWERVGSGKFKQRVVSLTRILRYAQAMKDGQWRLSPEPIVFDENGDLSNGQHRLEAVRRSGVTVPFMVTTGWPEEIMDVLDQGAVRNNATLLALRGDYGGYSSRFAGTMASIARIAHRGHSATLSFANCEYMLEKLGLRDNIEAILAKSPNYLKDFQSAIIAPLAYYHTVRPGKALQFADGYFNFETTKGSPVNLFLNWIKTQRYQASQPGIKTAGMHIYTRKMAGLCACLRAWDENTEITRVVTNTSAIVWLGDMNPKLRDWIKTHIVTISNLDKRARLNPLVLALQGQEQAKK